MFEIHLPQDGPIALEPQHLEIKEKSTSPGEFGSLDMRWVLGTICDQNPSSEVDLLELKICSSKQQANPLKNLVFSLNISVRRAFETWKWAPSILGHKSPWFGFCDQFVTINWSAPRMDPSPLNRNFLKSRKSLSRQVILAPQNFIKKEENCPMRSREINRLAAEN